MNFAKLFCKPKNNDYICISKHVYKSKFSDEYNEPPVLIFEDLMNGSFDLNTH